MRKLYIFAHSKDCNNIEFPNGAEHDGYVPAEIKIGKGDDFRFSIDIDTGKIVGWCDEWRDSILEFEKSLAEGDED